MAVSVTNGTLTIVATAETSLQLLYLRETIADSETWKALVALPRSNWNDVATKIAAGDASRDDALNAISLGRWSSAQANETVGSETPRILIRPFDEADVGFASLDTWEVTGLILMVLHIPIPTDLRTDSDITVAEIDFWQKADGILSDLNDVAQGLQAERISNTARFSRVVLPGEINPDQNNARRVRQTAIAISLKGSR